MLEATTSILEDGEADIQDQLVKACAQLLIVWCCISIRSQRISDVETMPRLGAASKRSIAAYANAASGFCILQSRFSSARVSFI